MKGPSLLRELAVDLALAHLVAVVAILLLVAQALETTVETLESRDMREMASDVLGSLEIGPNGDLVLQLPAATAARFSPSYGRYVYGVIDGEGRMLMSSFNAMEPLAAVSPKSEEAASFRVHLGSRWLFGVTVKGTIGQRPVFVQVAEDMNHRDVIMDEVTDGVLLRLLWGAIPFYVMLVVVAVVRTRRRLRPVMQVSEAAAQIGPAATGVRLPERQVPAEIRPLVVAVNTGLARLDQAFAAQREFIEDAAHEVRTPLTVLRTRIEATLDAETAKPLLVDIAIMSRMVTQLLRVAELEGLGATAHRPVDLAELVHAIATYLGPVGLAKQRPITVSGPETVMIEGNPEILGQAITNLVENAMAHTPEGTAVEVSLAATPCPTIRVRDHGPGVAPNERELVFRRFWRRERRRGSGAGLGLSIVHRAVQLHGGQVAVIDAEGGGAEFIITLPQSGN